MTIHDVWYACNGNYPRYSALFDRLVEVWGEHAAEIPILFPGTQRLLQIARERDWVRSDETGVMVDVPRPTR